MPPEPWTVSSKNTAGKRSGRDSGWKNRFEVSPRGVPSLDSTRKRFRGFYRFKRFKRFKGVGAAHKNQKRRGILIALRAAVIESVAEGLSYTPVSIT